MKEKQLRKELLGKVKKYYKEAFPQEDFIPGKSKINYGGRFFDAQEMVNLVDASLDFWLTTGRYTEQFEKNLANFLKVKYALVVNSGSSANLLAFMALTSDKLNKRKVQRGDEIITVAAGFPTTVAPIIQYGAIPVFVDVEMNTYNIDVEQLEKAISKKTKAIMIAHTLGNPFDVRKVKYICKKYNLWLIEDNCDSLGSQYNRKYTGSFGDISTCSFYPPHHITMGEGGAVATSNAQLYKILLSLRDWGRDCWCVSGKDNTCGKRFTGKHGELPTGYDHKYVYSHFGYNFKVTEMQAAIGCAQLEKLPNFIKVRRRHHQYLLNGLKKFKAKLMLPYPTNNSLPSWFGFCITIKDNAGFSRKELIEELEENNIQTRMLFAGNIIKQPCFDRMRAEKFGYKVYSNLDNTDKIMHNTFWLGVYPGQSKAKLDFIIKTINKFISNKEKISK
ncbi:MAG: lipopolysaccharide biosynthesis protein RfbH [Candidatus Margulisbacteria bacterium]|nr:lipopolysaccharide biosynthesis protein RfbH [Candidatus Margulisiibacteriota bacterium]